MKLIQLPASSAYSSDMRIIGIIVILELLIDLGFVGYE
jgi:hypothetical protein